MGRHAHRRVGSSRRAPRGRERLRRMGATRRRLMGAGRTLRRTRFARCRWPRHPSRRHDHLDRHRRAHVVVAVPDASRTGQRCGRQPSVAGATACGDRTFGRLAHAGVVGIAVGHARRVRTSRQRTRRPGRADRRTHRPSHCARELRLQPARARDSARLCPAAARGQQVASCRHRGSPAPRHRECAPARRCDRAARGADRQDGHRILAGCRTALGAGTSAARDRDARPGRVRRLDQLGHRSRGRGAPRVERVGIDVPAQRLWRLRADLWR